MKDKNGKEVVVGDVVRFFPVSSTEEWYIGVVSRIETGGCHRWGTSRKILPVAHIIKQPESRSYIVWERYGCDLELCELKENTQ